MRINKILLMALSILVLGGCSYGKSVEDYIENPPSLIEDPHFADYQKKLDALESQYLKKQITYAEYLEKKKEIDNQYSKEVKKREEVIHPQE